MLCDYTTMLQAWVMEVSDSFLLDVILHPDYVVNPEDFRLADTASTSIHVTPEPSSFVLFVLMGGILCRKRKR